MKRIRITKNAFYIFGLAQAQDIFPVLFESLRRGDDCWVCFFDCFLKKRQLANYDIEEISSFFQRRCAELNLSVPSIDFFKMNDQKKFESLYDDYRPEFVFVQEIKPRQPAWYPTAKTSKVIHFAWWDESKHLKDPLIDVDLSILKREEDLKYGYQNYPIACFGNLRLDHLSYSSNESRIKKRCFIPETYLRMSQKHRHDSMKIIQFCDDIMRFLKKNDFEIVWKKREKGYPIEGWASPLDYCSESPDVIIEKDLCFPTSLMDFAYRSDICLVINDCFAFFDMVHVNTNCHILTTHGGRKQKIDDFFVENHKELIIDMKSESGWKELQKCLEKTNDFIYNKTNVAGEIIDHCENLV